MTGSTRWMQRSLMSYAHNELKRIYNKNNELRNIQFMTVAYDNVVNTSWRDVIKSPFVMNATDEQLELAYQLLRKYKEDEEFLKLHILNSKQFKHEQKSNDQ